MTNTFSGEVVTAVRTTAFDPLGEGKDAYVAQLLAVHSGYVSGYAGGDGTIIYLRIYDATQKTQIWHTTTVGYLRFDIEEWQAIITEIERMNWQFIVQPMQPGHPTTWPCPAHPLMLPYMKCATGERKKIPMWIIRK